MKREEYIIKEGPIERQSREELRAEYKEYEAALAEVLGPELAALIVDKRVDEIISVSDKESAEGGAREARGIRLLR